MWLLKCMSRKGRQLKNSQSSTVTSKISIGKWSSSFKSLDITCFFQRDTELRWAVFRVRWERFLNLPTRHCRKKNHLCLLFYFVFDVNAIRSGGRDWKFTVSVITFYHLKNGLKLMANQQVKENNYSVYQTLILILTKKVAAKVPEWSGVKFH